MRRLRVLSDIGEGFLKNAINNDLFGVRKQCVDIGHVMGNIDMGLFGKIPYHQVKSGR